MKVEDFKYIKQVPGIYRIVNRKTDRCFVGRTLKLKRAILNHISNAKSGRYSGVELYDEIKRYGLDAFDFDVLVQYNVYPGKRWMEYVLRSLVNIYSNHLDASIIDLSKAKVKKR